MREEREETLQRLCLAFRDKLIDLLYNIQTEHPGDSPSCTEILIALYCELMGVDLTNPGKEGRNYLILSRGHGAPMPYLMLACKGFLPMDRLRSLHQMGSTLQDHPYVHKVPGVELSAGPLGLGLSVELGMALGTRLKGYNSYTYVAMGDGEMQEGCIWEAAVSASKFKADHLIDILDNNGVQLDNTLEDIVPIGDIKAKWEAFGWNVVPCDGHGMEDVCRAVEKAKITADKPSLILAKTVKGKGVSFMESRDIWHEKVIGDQDYTRTKAELGGEG